MSGQTLKLEIKINYPMFFGTAILAHLLMLVLVLPSPVNTTGDVSDKNGTPIKILRFGKPDSKSLNSVALKPQKASPPIARPASPKQLNLSDLTAMPSAGKAGTARARMAAQPSLRPGQMPKATTALSGLKYGADDFQRMAQDPMLSGAAHVLNSKRIALNFELPQGKNLDELNESELKLYSFLRRGAIKYVNSLSAEIKEFEMKNPHLQFPLTDAKQVLTGRMVFDKQGNLKQIKMVRWTNVGKLQSFFENVLKRLDTLQNPPQELWAQDGEFAIFVTLQVNG
jgi:hypothetical protein